MKTHSKFHLFKGYSANRPHDLSSRFTVYIITALALLVSSGCTKHDDFEFSGTVIGVEHCSSMSSVMDLGYLVAIDHPDTIGRTFTAGGTTYRHVVVLYEASEMLHNHDIIKGTMFWSENYSKANCSVHYTDRDLPEGVFTSVEVIE